MMEMRRRTGGVHESGGWLVLEDVTVTLTRVRRRSNEHMVPILL